MKGDPKAWFSKWRLPQVNELFGIEKVPISDKLCDLDFESVSQNFRALFDEFTKIGHGDPRRQNLSGIDTVIMIHKMIES